jgi:hypothetical protein
MPEQPVRAPAALRNPGSSRRSAMAARAVLGAIFAMSVLAVPQLTSPEPVAAGSSCTGWASTTKPPKTVRVLRTGSGRVETVGFRSYVAEVMASGEWPSRLHKATLEAGAVFTKQYAWYYAMRGHHRPGYVSGGKCYDVRDDTRDQLYRPDRAWPTGRQHAAIDKTWALTLRKNGRFFLTGYRLGTTGSSARDANGWKLYERSADNCASKGWSSKRILSRYLSPNLKFVWSAASGPVISKPNVVLKAGNSIASGAATLYWKPAGDMFRVAKYKLQRKIGGGKWKDLRLPRDDARKADVWLKPGFDNHFRVRARDTKGRFGPWSHLATRKAAVRGPVGRVLGGGSVQTANTTPAKISITTKGHAAALVAKTGPGMGRAKVFIDGRHVATIDLDRNTVDERKLVWAKNWYVAKSRTISVKAVNSGGPVAFKGLFTLS